MTTLPLTPRTIAQARSNIARRVMRRRASRFAAMGGMIRHLPAKTLSRVCATTLAQELPGVSNAAEVYAAALAGRSVQA
jgi:hypothetical protein